MSTLVDQEKQTHTSKQFVTSRTIKWLFAKFTVRYGNKFTSQYSVDLMQALQEEFYSELKGYTSDDIKRGLDAWFMKGTGWPPNAEEFGIACKPPKPCVEDIPQLQKLFTDEEAKANIKRLVKIVRGAGVIVNGR